ncbi:class I lanthipeptide [Taibaiella koreensis]|uniref:class I lanthipeptide n=1 Tax=Taibaiella koreensis TaxID=1268548 RepID=UPI000E59E1EA|nr:class I lanthipeptide [Taibaiella koreensis]
MKKKKLSLHAKLILRKEPVTPLSRPQQEQLAGGQATESCQCPTPPVTVAYNCPVSHQAQKSCFDCIRSILNEKTENLCY